jgi:hypothetical protein
MDVSDARRLRTLEDENAKLKKSQASAGSGRNYVVASPWGAEVMKREDVNDQPTLSIPG